MAWTTTRSQLATAHRRAKARGQEPDPATIARLQQQLKAERAENYIQRLVDEAPPLTAGQVGRLQAILSTAHDEVLDASGLPDSGYGGGLDSDAA